MSFECLLVYIHTHIRTYIHTDACLRTHIHTDACLSETETYTIHIDTSRHIQDILTRLSGKRSPITRLKRLVSRKSSTGDTHNGCLEHTCVPRVSRYVCLCERLKTRAQRIRENVPYVCPGVSDYACLFERQRHAQQMPGKARHVCVHVSFLCHRQ